jgi:hypothetical protein
VRTISRAPAATARASASTAAAERLREAPADERDHAEVAREAAAVLDLHERAHAVEASVGLHAAQRADVAATRPASPRSARDHGDVSGRPAKESAAEFAAQP